MHLNVPRTCVDRIVRATQVWYDREARGYGERTWRFDQFPGLLAEISGFARGLTTLSGPVLDLGCGAGRDTEFLLDNGFDVVSADLSMAMLVATRNRCARSWPVQLDMRELPFRSDTFRGAWICASLVHMPPAGIPGVLTEVYRTVRDGGNVAISMRHGGHGGDGRRFTRVDPAAFQRLLGEHGFVNCRSVSSGRGDWFITHGTKPETGLA